MYEYLDVCSQCTSIAKRNVNLKKSRRATLSYSLKLSGHVLILIPVTAQIFRDDELNAEAIARKRALVRTYAAIIYEAQGPRLSPPFLL